MKFSSMLSIIYSSLIFQELHLNTSYHHLHPKVLVIENPNDILNMFIRRVTHVHTHFLKEKKWLNLKFLNCFNLIENFIFLLCEIKMVLYKVPSHFA